MAEETRPFRLIYRSQSRISPEERSSILADIPLHATAGQIRSAARQPVTKEQSAVLRTMCNTIGAESL
jgi:hypothetical protein